MVRNKKSGVTTDDDSNSYQLLRAVSADSNDDKNFHVQVKIYLVVVDNKNTIQSMDMSTYYTTHPSHSISLDQGRTQWDEVEQRNYKSWKSLQILSDRLSICP